MNWKPVFCSITTVFLLFFPSLPVSGQEPAPQSAVVVRVNDAPIRQADLNREIELAKQNRSTVITRNSSNIKEILRKESLDKLIALELLFQESRRMGVTLGSVAVEKRYRERQEQHPDGRAAFEKAIIASGSTVAEFRQAIAKELTVNKFINTIIAERITISEEELRQQYEKHKTEFYEPEKATVRHIFIKKDDSQPEKDLEKMQAVKARIDKGSDFAETASRYSENSSAAEGGLLGPIYRGQMPSIIDEAIFSLEPQQTSAILQTSTGCHLLQMVEKVPLRYLSYDESLNTLFGRLKQKKIGDRVRTLVRDRKKTAIIKY